MRPDDEDAFVAISRDEAYQRYYDESDCEADKYRQLTRLFVAQAHETPRTAYQLAIEYRETGDFIGTVCLRLEDKHDASFGVGLDCDYQGRGLMREAASALLCYGFQHLNVHRIYAETLHDNTAAVRLCQSLGMRQMARHHADRYFKGQWWDTVIMAIVKSEWLSHHSNDGK